MIEVFLDTTILLGKILGRSKEAERIFESPSIQKHTSEYALKEVYHVLKKQYHYSEMEIGYAIDYIREKCKVLPMPTKEEIQMIKIRDKSDRPIVYSAYKYGLILYIDDAKTFQDAQKYIQVERIFKNK